MDVGACADTSSFEIERLIRAARTKDLRMLPCLEDLIITTRAEHSGQLGAGLRGSRDP
jgi:hypothetical protein